MIKLDIQRRTKLRQFLWVVLLSPVLLVACAEPEIDRLVQEYCAYFASAPEMTFEEQQKTITELDKRLIGKSVRQGRMLSALRQACPGVIARTEVEMMGIMGRDLQQMQREMRELTN